MLKRVLITGASGFIGSNLARRLIHDGHEVHLLLRPEHNAWRLEQIKDQIHAHTADLLSKENVRQAVNEIKPHWVFHLAAYGAYSQQDDYTQAVLTNILGTHYLTEAAMESGVESFINVGSSSEYGFKDHAPQENEALEPNSYYALTKAYATMLCQYSARKSAVGFVTLRPYSVYGPFEEPTRLMPTVLLHAMEGRWPALVSPDIARDFIYVDDFTEVCVLAARSAQRFNGAVYNVGTGTQTSLKEVVDLIKQEFTINEQPIWGSMDNRSWDTQTWVSDSRRIRQDLGWQNQWVLRDGLLKLAEWFRSEASMLEYYKEKVFSVEGAA